MLGRDLVLPPSLVKDSRIDYVALGHIHRSQDLNEGSHPPVVYPGSIERVDFGEVEDEKFFVVATVEKGKASVDWRKLEGIRPFLDRFLSIESQEGITNRLRGILPSDELRGAIVRLVLEYPRDWESLIDEAALREHTSEAFEFYLVKRPQAESRVRLPADQAIGSLTPLELLDLYWRANHVDPAESQELNELGAKVIHEAQAD
jgi:exonuclease SbcD